MSDLIKERSDIPTDFRRGIHPAAKNVGELIDVLSRLPRSLALSHNCEDYVGVMVPSVNGRSDFVCDLRGIEEDEYRASKRHYKKQTSGGEG